MKAMFANAYYNLSSYNGSESIETLLPLTMSCSTKSKNNDTQNITRAL